MLLAGDLRKFLPLLTLFVAQNAIATECPSDKGVALQILGSGGPIADDGRASSGYLIWVDGHSTALIDAGGGTFLRFGEAKANFADLDFVGLSHFHADHSADFPALLKSGYFSNRDRSLIVTGPDGGGPFPGLGQFLDGLLNKETGAYAYLGGYLEGTDRLPQLTATEVPSASAGPVTVLGDRSGSMQIDALHVPHGIVPALAYRVRVNSYIIVFASDQNGDKEEFIDFAENADILVMHMPIPERATGAARKLHAPPSLIGEIANSANVELLVLSHIMERSERNLDQNVAGVESKFRGRIEIANDLDCYVLDKPEK